MEQVMITGEEKKGKAALKPNTIAIGVVIVLAVVISVVVILKNYKESNKDTAGISPSDIYAIDVKNFREAVQGLAMHSPKHIRVSFVANLDNIILENYSSLEILDLAEE